jgi:hypothetical protein
LNDETNRRAALSECFAHCATEDTMAHANPIQIQKYLKGVDYPASKQALIQKARELGADDNICASLEQLPDEQFQTPADVSEAFRGPSGDATRH